MKTEVVISATQPAKIMGEKSQRLRELTSIIQKRFNFAPESVELFIERVNYRGLSANVQAESIHYKLMAGLAVRRACYGVIRYIMDAGAKGCEVIISGKLRAQRAKAMKFREGYMVKSGYSCVEFVDVAVRHAKMRQGVLGIKVKIMKPYDPHGKLGPKKQLADVVTILDPKEDGLPSQEQPERRRYQRREEATA